MKLSAAAFELGSVQVSRQAILILVCIFAAHYILFGVILEKKPRAWIGKGFGKALAAGAKHPGNLMKYLLVEISLLLLGLSPLLFLFAPGYYRYLAALAYPLWLLVVNPARMNAAAAMQDCLMGGSIFSWRLADFSHWRDQVVSGAKRMGFLLLWMLPLAGTALYLWSYWVEVGKVDAITWVNMMKDAGNDDFMTGVINTALPLVVMLGASLVILVIGIAFHSGARHAMALGKPGLVSGHHGKLVLGWFCSLVFLAPLFIAGLILVNRILSLTGSKVDVTELLNQVKGLKSDILLTVGGGILLTLPLLPFRSLMIASMVNHIQDDSPDTES